MQNNYYIANHEPKTIQMSVVNDPNNWYPNNPGFKAQETSRQAAQDIKPKASILRQKVLELIRDSVFGISPDKAAAQLGESILSIRPRFSELKAKGLIVDSGRRDLTEFHKASIIWVAV